jgi:hypothetical protein
MFYTGIIPEMVHLGLPNLIFYMLSDGHTTILQTPLVPYVTRNIGQGQEHEGIRRNRTREDLLIQGFLDSTPSSGKRQLTWHSLEPGFG